MVTLPAPFAAGGVINKQALQCGIYIHIQCGTYIYIRSSMSPITYSKEPARGAFRNLPPKSKSSIHFSSQQETRKGGWGQEAQFSTIKI